MSLGISSINRCLHRHIENCFIFATHIFLPMKVLMVCLGNICRSPLAEGILLAKAKEKGIEIETDSAGTSGYHDGELPDGRSIEIARHYDIDISNQRSRKLVKKDLQHYDYILTMDASNYQNTLRLCESDSEKSKVKLILNYSFPDQNRQVPDPYYEGGFDHVYQLLNEACEAFLIASHPLYK